MPKARLEDQIEKTTTMCRILDALQWHYKLNSLALTAADSA